MLTIFVRTIIIFFVAASSATASVNLVFPEKHEKLKSFKDCLAQLEKQRSADLKTAQDSAPELQISVTESGVVQSGKGLASYRSGVEQKSSYGWSFSSTNMICKGKNLTVRTTVNRSHP
jgi:hypothetical protein